jgi:hypothetical protein
MRKFFPVLILCGFFPVILHAQQYLIRYDLSSMKSNFYHIGQDTSRVKKVDLKKNGRIILRVENFNPYYWNAKVTSYKNPVDEESGFGNAFNPLAILTRGFGDIMSNLPMLDIPKSKGIATDPNSRFLSTAAKYSEEYEKVQMLTDKYEELSIVQMQLQELKFNNVKTEVAIKSEARDLVVKTLGTDSLSLLTFVHLGKQYNNELVNALYELSNLNKDLQDQMPLVNPDNRVDGKTFKEIAQKTNSSYSALSKITSLQQNSPAFMMDKVVEVGNLYRDIEKANFNFTYSVNTEPDLSYLKLELFPKDNTISKDTMVQYFQLNGKKNMKIRNSVGVAFGYFNANNYFIDNDSVIRKGKGDLFVPLISTFIHFYSGKTTGFRWGGTFGVGIPVTGEKKDINFLLGITTALGQNEPILLSAGFSGGKVSKLANGYETGQKTKLTSTDKLLTSSYDIGGFVSVSFNLGSLGKK